MFKKIVIAATLLFSAVGTASAVSVELVNALQKAAPTLDRQVLELALHAVERAERTGQGGDHRLTVIDYSLASTEPRLWVFDIDARELLYHERVAHGKNTGGNYAKSFSNTPDSKQTSIGLFRTAGTYVGGNGYSLKLDGLDKGFNDNARKRYIVMHGAWYVNDDLIEQQGRIGRSWGCPAVRDEIARELIDSIKDGSLVFAYYPDQRYLASSQYTQGSSAGTMLAAP